MASAITSSTVQVGSNIAGLSTAVRATTVGLLIGRRQQTGTMVGISRTRVPFLQVVLPFLHRHRRRTIVVSRRPGTRLLFRRVFRLRQHYPQHLQRNLQRTNRQVGLAISYRHRVSNTIQPRFAITVPTFFSFKRRHLQHQYVGLWVLGLTFQAWADVDGLALGANKHRIRTRHPIAFQHGRPYATAVPTHLTFVISVRRPFFTFRFLRGVASYQGQGLHRPNRH